MFNVTSKFATVKLASQESLASSYSNEKLASLATDILFERYEDAKEKGELVFDTVSSQYHRPAGINQPHTKYSLVFDWHTADSSNIHFIKELYNRLELEEQIGHQPFLYKDDKGIVQQSVNEFGYFQLDETYFVKLYKIYPKGSDKYKFLLSLELTAEANPAELRDIESQSESNVRKQEYKRNTYGSIPRQESQGSKQMSKKPALS